MTRNHWWSACSMFRTHRGRKKKNVETSPHKRTQIFQAEQLHSVTSRRTHFTTGWVTINFSRNQFAILCSVYVCLHKCVWYNFIFFILSIKLIIKTCLPPSIPISVMRQNCIPLPHILYNGPGFFVSTSSLIMDSNEITTGSMCGWENVQLRLNWESSEGWILPNADVGGIEEKKFYKLLNRSDIKFIYVNRNKTLTNLRRL